MRALEISGTILGYADDKEFYNFASQLNGISASPIYKLHLLWETVPQIRGMVGAMAEIGVWRGGSAKLILERLKRLGISGQDLLLFDTYSGMPATDPNVDAHKQNDFNNTSVEEVEKRLSSYEGYQIIPGLFPASGELFRDYKFKWVHIDVDIYRSVFDCCTWFYEKMVPGGIMIFDDYGTHSCFGGKKAVDDFFADKTEAVIYLPTTQALVIKH